VLQLHLHCTLLFQFARCLAFIIAAQLSDRSACPVAPIGAFASGTALVSPFGSRSCCLAAPYITDAIFQPPQALIFLLLCYLLIFLTTSYLITLYCTPYYLSYCVR